MKFVIQSQKPATVLSFQIKMEFIHRIATIANILHSIKKFCGYFPEDVTVGSLTLFY